MLIDKTNPQLLTDNLNKEIAFTRERHDEVANIFRTMGTYAPVFGLLGTLIGVIQVLNKKNVKFGSEPYSNVDIEMLQNLAYNIQMTIENILSLCIKKILLSQSKNNIKTATIVVVGFFYR